MEVIDESQWNPLEALYLMYKYGLNLHLHISALLLGDESLDVGFASSHPWFGGAPALALLVFGFVGCPCIVLLSMRIVSHDGAVHCDQAYKAVLAQNSNCMTTCLAFKQLTCMIAVDMTMHHHRTSYACCIVISV